MEVNVDLKSVKEKVGFLLPKDLEEKFSNWFDEEGYIDIMENVEDYIVEGVLNFYLDNYEER